MDDKNFDLENVLRELGADRDFAKAMAKWLRKEEQTFVAAKTSALNEIRLAEQRGVRGLDKMRGAVHEFSSPDLTGTGAALSRFAKMVDDLELGVAQARKTSPQAWREQAEAATKTVADALASFSRARDSVMAVVKSNGEALAKLKMIQSGIAALRV